MSATPSPADVGPSGLPPSTFCEHSDENFSLTLGNAHDQSISFGAEVCVTSPKSASGERTTSVSRSYSHLDCFTFMASTFFLCALRTIVQQPLNIALIRKQSAPAFQSQSTTTILRHIFLHEGGMRGILRGMPALTLGCASSEVVYLGLLEYGREQLPFKSEGTRAALAGYLSDGACRLLHIPLSIVAYRQMSQGMEFGAVGASSLSGPSHYSAAGKATCSSSVTTVKQPILNSFRTLQQMYSERGLRTVYAGLGTTLVVGSQWSAVWWPLYGTIKEKLYHYATPMLHELPPNKAAKQSSLTSPSSLSSLRWSSTSTPTTQSCSTENRSGESTTRLWAWIPRSFTDPVDNAVVSTIASAITSASTAIIFNPFLVIRTNLQVQPSASLWSVSKSIYLQRGFRGFYSGLYLSMMTCVLDGTLASLSYEYARLWADKTKWSSQTL